MIYEFPDGPDPVPCHGPMSRPINPSLLKNLYRDYRNDFIQSISDVKLLISSFSIQSIKKTSWIYIWTIFLIPVRIDRIICIDNPIFNLALFLALLTESKINPE